MKSADLSDYVIQVEVLGPDSTYFEIEEVMKKVVDEVEVFVF